MGQSTSELIRAQAALNASTRLGWARYAGHRQKVMDLVGQPDGSVALLGAGNCNDIDLPALGRTAQSLDLFDIDPSACDAAIAEHARLGCPTSVHEADLSGVLPHLQQWKTQPPTPAQLREIPTEASRAVKANVDDTFDLVVSAGVLSQLIWSCMTSLGTDHPSLRAAALTAMMAHIRVATDLSAAGGTVVLVVDTVARPPNVWNEVTAEMDLADVLVAMEAGRKCLPGTEPAIVVQALRHHGRAAAMAAPWLWTVSETRTSLVYALVSH